MLPLGSEVETKEEPGLLTYVVAEETAETRIVTLIKPIRSSPYSDQTPTQILSRWRQIGSTLIATSTTPGVQVFSAKTLYDNPVNISILDLFKLFRFDAVEFRIQYSSIPQVFGLFALTTLPYHNGWTPTITYCMRHKDTILLDVSQQQDVVISSPWIATSDWMDIDTEDISDRLDPLNRVNLVHLVPLQSLSSVATATVNVIVFARFVNPKTAGFRGSSDLFARQPREVQFQMDASQVHPVYTFTNKLTTAVAGAAAIGGGVIYKKLTGAAEKAFDQGVAEVKEAVEEVMGVAEETVVLDAPVDQEQDVRLNNFGSLQSRDFAMMETSLYKGGPRFKISDWLRVPCYDGSSILDNTREGTIVVSQCKPNGGRLGYLANFYKFWTGSITYDIYFIASPFISARYLIYLNMSDDQSAVVPGDAILKDVTIRGSHKETVTVPYLSPLPFQPTAQTQELTSIQQVLRIQTLTSPIYEGDVAPVMRIVTFIRPGPDFCFRCRKDPHVVTIGPAPPREVQFQMKISEFVDHDSMYADVRTMTEGACYFEDFMGRYFRVPDTTSPELIVHDNGYQHIPGSVFDYIGILFKYGTGSYRLKIVGPAPEQTDVYMGVFMTRPDYDYVHLGGVNVPAFERTWDGANIVNISQTLNVELTVPYQCVLPIRPYNESAFGVLDGSLTNILPQRYAPQIEFSTVIQPPPVLTIYQALGSDFTFVYDLPPPPENYWPNFRTAI